ncbi:MAG: hypothetical protein ACI9Y1_000133 [Lentisphaeria bacterium]|jgi:hypothetical protein
MNITIRLQKKRPNRLMSSALVIGMATLLASVQSFAVTPDQAKRIHERIAGTTPSAEMLADMEAATDGVAAAYLAMDNQYDDSFYNVTLKNMAAPWASREGDVFADLNDYIATVIGFVKDDLDFRGILSDDILYTGSDALGAAVAPYSPSNNQHYLDIEAQIGLNGEVGVSLKDDLVVRTQSQLVPALAAANGKPQGASGVITSRAGAKAFLIAGTNRAAFRFTLINHLCLDLEQVHDVTRIPDRIRQDVSRSPGGDSRIFLNTCIGCHNGMDPMAQAMAYHNYFVADIVADPTGEGGQVEYTPGTVQSKYFNNDTSFPPGYITPDDSWANYWRAGKNSALGWDTERDASGTGISAMFAELAHTRAFASCHVNRVFKAMCLRDPVGSDEGDLISGMIDGFMVEGNLKDVFAQSADQCKGVQ